MSSHRRIPPPPPGFVLDRASPGAGTVHQPQSQNVIPPPPPGFVLDDPSAPPAPPPFSTTFSRQGGTLLQPVQAESAGLPSFVGPGVVGEFAGQEIGRRGGMALGVPFGPAGIALGAIIGGGTGGVAGKQAEIAAREKRLLTLPEAGKAFAFGAGGEALGKLAGLKKTIPFFKNKAEQGVQAVKDFLAKSNKFLTPAQATTSRTLDVLENIAEGSLLGGGRVVTFKEGQEQAVQAGLKEVSKKFISEATPEQTGKLFTEMLSGRQRAHRAVTPILYRRIDKITQSTRGTLSRPPPIITDIAPGASAAGRTIPGSPGTGIPFTKRVAPGTPATQGIGIPGKAGTKVVQSPLASAAIGVRTDGIKQIVAKRLQQNVGVPSALTSDTGKALLQQMQELPEVIPFELAARIRSKLLNITRPTGELVGKEAVQTAKGLTKVIDDAMEQAARNHSPQALEAWRLANQFVKEGAAKFDNQIIRTMAKQAKLRPERLGRQLNSAIGTGNVSDIKAVRDVVGAGGTVWKRVQSGVWDDILGKITDTSGRGSGAKLLEVIKKSKPGLTEVFDESTVRGIQEFAETAAFIQTKQLDKTGQVFIKLTQGSAGLTLALTGFEAGAAVIVFGPLALGRLFTSPKAVKWLTEGLTLSAKTPEAVSIGTRLLLIASQERALPSQIKKEQAQKQLNRIPGAP